MTSYWFSPQRPWLMKAQKSLLKSLWQDVLIGFLKDLHLEVIPSGLTLRHHSLYK